MLTVSDKVEVNKINFVSRAENKLAEAAKAFHYDFGGKVILDIGSSTGGFTEYALNNGARQVIAIEKGTRQMKAPLRFNQAVDLHEKTDIFDVKRQDLSVLQDTKLDTVLADVSFISLKKVLEYVKKHLSDVHTDYLVMLKPQFEAEPEQLNKGIVKNEKIRRKIIHDYEFWLKENGFSVVQKRDNTFLGKNGNRERFYWLKNAA